MSTVDEEIARIRAGKREPVGRVQSRPSPGARAADKLRSENDDLRTKLAATTAGLELAERTARTAYAVVKRLRRENANLREHKEVAEAEAAIAKAIEDATV